jgi:hypothetical protein
MVDYGAMSEEENKAEVKKAAEAAKMALKEKKEEAKEAIAN